MTYSIRISDETSSDIIEMEDVNDIWAWFDAHCNASECGETIELMQDGKVVQTFFNG